MNVQGFVVRVLILAFLLTVAVGLSGPPDAEQHRTQIAHAAASTEEPDRLVGPLNGLELALAPNAPPPCPDLYEPNNEFDTAWQLWPGKLVSYICDESDQDYFSFWANAGQLIHLELFDMPANYDLCLYDPGRLGLECSENAGTMEELIERTADQSGVHYAQVYGVGGAYHSTSTYTFRLDVTPCTAVTGVNIGGPTTGIISTTQTFTATVDPPAATLPVGYTWQTTAQSDIVQTGSFIQTVVSYTWDFTGTQTVAVEAVNCGDAVTAAHTITVEEVPPAPDLAITEVWALGTGIWYQVHNGGDATAPAGHGSSLVVDGVLRDVNLVDVSLLPGERLTRRFTGGDWSWYCTGVTDQITVCADLGEAVDESDEANNCREETWKCDDTSPQIISGPSVSVLSDTATIIWQTDEDSDSVVRFDTQAGKYDLVEEDASLGTDHSIQLTQLPPASVYHYVVESKDGAGNTASSREGFFELPPAQDSQPPTIENVFVTAGPAAEGQTEYYVISALVSDNTGVERVLFYMDDQLLETDYSALLGEYRGYVIPAAIEGMTRPSFFESHDITIEAIDRAGSSSSHWSPWTPDFEPAEVDLRIELPYRDHTIYIDDSVTPPGTIVPMTVYAAESEFRCTWFIARLLPNTPPVRCDDENVAVSRVEYYVNSELIHTSIPPTSRDMWHHYDWPASELSPGIYDIEVRAVARDGTVFSEERTFTVELGEPSLEVTRSVSRIDNYFRVRLTVENEGTGTAEMSRVVDYVSGFQPIAASTTFYTVSPEYRTAPRDSRVQIDLFGSTPHSYDLPPDGSVNLEYDAVPVLHPDLSTFEYSIGAESVIVTDPLRRSLGTFSRPSVSTQGGELLVQSVTSATLMSDYLLVTHPWRLYAFYDDGEVDALLSTMAHLARLKRGVLGYLHHMGSLDGSGENAEALAGLTEPGGDDDWAAQMHPDFSTVTAGYLMLVGEAEIVNTWHSSGWDMQWVDGSTTNEVPYTDHPYADTGGDGAPDLVVGRIIGNSASHLTAPLQASIGVHVGTAGYGFGRTNALLVSGTGDSQGDFVRNVNGLENILDPAFSPVYKVHWKDFWYLDSLPRVYDEHDGLGAGDVLGDSKHEIILGDASEDRIYILDEHGSTLGDFARDLEAGDGLAVGDVLGDSKDDIIIGDSSADQICSYSSAGVELGCFSQDFEPFDGLTAGEVLPNFPSPEKEEIVMADQAGHLLFLNGDGDLLNAYPFDFEAHDGLALGDLDWVSNPYDEDEIVLADASRGEIRIVCFDGGGYNWSRSFDRDFATGNGLTVAEVSGDDRAEIVVGDITDGHIYYYAFNVGEQRWIEWRKYDNDFASFDGLAAGDVAGDDKAEILIGDRDNQIRITDALPDERMFSAVSARASGLNVLYFSGHGNVDLWSPGLETDRLPLDFGSSNPFVFAPSCLTGDYESDDDEYNIAEAFLDSGAAVYIGSTEVSPISKNCDAGGWFFRNWAPDESIGDTFNELERGKWSQGRLWRFWVTEYNLYGDPKYGAVPPLGAGAAPALVAMQPPTTSLQIEIPMFEVITTVAGLDYVEIPGGELLLEEGQHRLPYWSVSVDYPQGYEVQDVVLTDRSGLTTTMGLNLPVVTMDLASSPVQSDARPDLSSSGSGEGWVPEEEYRWEIMENADGSSTLVVAIYPFYYWPDTTAVWFYQDYSLDIDVISSTVEITFLTIEENAYPQGDQVPVDFWLSNEGAAQDVMVNAVVKEAISGEVVGGLPLDSLKTLTSTASFSSQWDSTGHEPGTYYVQAEVRDTAGAVLDRKLVEFRLGIYAGEITAFSVAPTLFDIGDTITTSLVFSNTGTLAITGTAVIQVQNEAAGIVQEFEHDVTNLAPGSAVTIDDAWDTSGAEEGNYSILGYFAYDSQMAGPMLAAISTYRRVYLPLIMR